MVQGAGRITRRITVHGRVQGVWFRAWTVARATELSLDGWVRNRADGTVEAVARGPAEAVDALIALCGEGPPGARVDRVDTEATPEIVASGFRQKTTA